MGKKIVQISKDEDSHHIFLELKEIFYIILYYIID